MIVMDGMTINFEAQEELILCRL